MSGLAIWASCLLLSGETRGQWALATWAAASCVSWQPLAQEEGSAPASLVSYASA